MNDRLHTLLRDSLGEQAEALPVTTPSWERVRGGMEHVRRVRRRRRTTIAAGLAVLVMGGLAGVLLPGAQDRAGVADPDREPVRATAVFGRTTVGSLAGDRGFLDDLRTAFLANPRAIEEGGLVPGTRPKDVLVPFAGDVGDVRVALVEVPVTGTEASGETFLWFVAPAGATATRLVGEQTVKEEPAAASTFVWAATGRPADEVPPVGDRGTGALVVLDRGTENLLLTTSPPTYAADGKRSWDLTTPRRTSDHHWEIAVPWSDPAVPAGWFSPPGDLQSWVELGPPEATDQVRSGVRLGAGSALRTGAGADPTLAAAALWAVQRESGVPLDDSSRRVLWTGKVGGNPSSVVAVKTARGARVLGALTTVRLSDGWVEDLRTTVVPAGETDYGIGFAWGIDVRGENRVAVAVLGPKRAVRAVVTDQAGARETVTLTDGVGLTAKAADVSAVEFTDASGARVGTGYVNTPFNGSPPNT